MKKFIAISCAFLLVIVALITTFGCIHPKLQFSFDNPETIAVYAKSYSAISNGTGGKDFSEGGIKYRNILGKVKNMTNLSMLSYLAHSNSTKPVVEQDISGKYPNYSSSLLEKSYAVAFNFKEKQSQIVYYKGDTKKVEYFGFIIIMDANAGYGQVPIYFKTSSSGSYEKSPMLVYANTKQLIKYIESIK